MKSTSMRRLLLVLPLAAYGIFLWRSPYGLMHPVLGILDWVAVAVGLGFWLLRRRRHGEPWPETRLNRPLLAWLVVTAIMALFSINPRVSFEALWATLTDILILYLLVDAIRRGWGSPLWRSLYLLAGVTFLLSLIELLAWYFGLPLFPAIQEGWLSIGGLSAPIPPVIHRLSYALVNPTALSGFVALLIPPALSTLPAIRDRETRVGLLLWMAAAAVTLFLALSRGGFLALGASFLVIALGGVSSPQFRRWWSQLPKGTSRILIATTVLVFLTLTIAVGFLLVNRLAQHRSGDTVRLDLWRSALEMFRDHPLTGVGPAAYGTALREYRNPLLARDQLNEAHNVYLEVGAEMGIPGLIIGGWLLLALLWAWRRRWRAESPGTPGWWRTLGVGAGLAGLGVRSLVDGFVDSAIILPTLLFTAFLLASPRDREARPTPWKWIVAAIALTLGIMGLAWDSWAYIHFSRSLGATTEGRVDGALEAVQRARRIDPWMPLYACHAGYLQGLQVADGQETALSPALDQYQDCLQTLPAGWVERTNRASLLWEAGSHPQAHVAILETTLDTPLEWIPWLNRGIWAESGGDHEDAAYAYAWVLWLEPELGSSPFWHQGDRSMMWPQILSAAERVQAETGASESKIDRWRLRVAVAHGDLERAVGQLEAWLETHPHDAEAMTWIGEALLGLNRAQEAFTWLERAASADPSHAESYVARGEAALALGDYDEAQQSFRTALFLEPSNRAHLGLARYYQARGQTEEAMHEYAQALRMPTVIHTYDLVLYRRAGWAMPLPQVTQIAPHTNGAAALEWGALLEEEGDPEKAQRVYEVALNADPFFEAIRRRIEE